ncbi:hypothetical protein DFH07DRAFT_948896 [Mycena maculata]|uniref:DNA recombination and repair protein Rad51-like C-terminal domain-containing protein n=1 Tax=Mycena maculata TaxID=230809 RepID=A0AAD7P1I0_9AGAR|nr:hypothetical protein DFH07DRAFT_948896 [Mycena maculata]
MLDDIPSEQIFSLLTAVRTAVPPPRRVPIPDFPLLNWGDVLEIQGPSASGKTHLLYSLLATCIMPSSHHFIDLGGWGKGAVVFDTDGTFDTRQFHSLLLCAFSRSRISPDDIQHLAASCLRKLHVFCPGSTAQLAASIAHLPAYHTAHIPDTDIALVAVDSLSAFYWSDRFTAEQMRPLALPNSSTPLQHVLTALQAFRVSHNPITLLTNWGLTLAENTNGMPPMYKQHLPFFPSFPALPGSHNNVPSDILLPLTHHITLHLTPIPPFHSNPSFPDEADVRHEVAGYVRRPSSSQVDRFLVDVRT